MSEREKILIELYGYCSEKLYQKNIIDYCAQVGIIEYDPDVNVNHYLTVLTDYYHSFLFKKHKLLKSIIDDFMKHRPKQFGLDVNFSRHDIVINTKALFDALKNTEFHDPVTADYYLEFLATGKTTFHANLPSYEKIQSPPSRDNKELWNFGTFLEISLMHRNDAPVYANTFFSFDKKLLAIALFIQDKKIEKYDEVIDSTINDFFSAKGLKNTIPDLIDAQNNFRTKVNEKVSDLRKAIKLTEFSGSSNKILRIIEEHRSYLNGTINQLQRYKIIDARIRNLADKKIITKQDIIDYKIDE